MIPKIFFTIFGTSKQLAVGSVALNPFLFSDRVLGTASLRSKSYILLAVLRSFIYGVVKVSFGMFRLEFLVKFLPKLVISGFTSAAV